MPNGTLDDMCKYITSDPVLDFGAPSWYLTSQCKPDVQAGLKTGGETEWETYVRECVGIKDIAAEPDRKTYYEKAISALGG